MPVVDLPLGATEDRVVGALDLERALTQGVKAFEPGLLARAHRGFLYIDEVNLLEDHLVDLLLDVAASGENVVEREGLSVRHPARFVLVGTGNPEEGELRPQLLDRFGLSVEVKSPDDLATRVSVVRRRDDFERNPETFDETWQKEAAKLRKRIVAGRRRLAGCDLSGHGDRNGSPALHAARDRRRARRARLSSALPVPWRRSTAIRAVDNRHLRRVAPSALRHRLRRDPLDEAGSSVRVERAVGEVFGA